MKFTFDRVGTIHFMSIKCSNGTYAVGVLKGLEDMRLCKEAFVEDK